MGGSYTRDVTLEGEFVRGIGWGRGWGVDRLFWSVWFGVEVHHLLVPRVCHSDGRNSLMEFGEIEMVRCRCLPRGLRTCEKKKLRVYFSTCSLILRAPNRTSVFMCNGNIVRFLHLIDVVYISIYSVEMPARYGIESGSWRSHRCRKVIC